MHIPQGALDKSTLYFMVPSPMAERLLFHATSFGHYYCDSTYFTERRTYESYLLLYMLDGTLHVNTEAYTAAVSAGELLVLNCYEYHKYYATENCEFTFLHVAGSNSRELCDEIVRINGPVCKPFDGDRVQECMEALIAAAATGQRQSEVINSVMLYNLLLELMQNRSVSATHIRKHMPLEETLKYISDNLSRRLTLDELADKSGFSKYHFARVFKMHMHMSPYQYIRMSRIQKAQLLLATTHLTVKEIAWQTGFNSESNFTYAFSQQVGMPPQAFRKEA